MSFVVLSHNHRTFWRELFKEAAPTKSRLFKKAGFPSFSLPFVIFEVVKMDTSTSTIRNLFYKQIRNLTYKTCELDSFDIQFSDRWL